MVNLLLKKEILEVLSRLNHEQQRQVLDFAHTLTMTRVVGMPGKELLSFAGAIKADDLQTMTQAIEEGCEKSEIEGLIVEPW